MLSIKACRRLKIQSRRARCANSCASTASTWAGPNWLIKPIGNNTTGFSHPAVIGALVRADSKKRTLRRRPKRSASFSKCVSHSAGTGESPWRRKRRNWNNPPVRRTTKKRKPQPHKTTNKVACSSNQSAKANVSKVGSHKNTGSASSGAGMAALGGRISAASSSCTEVGAASGRQYHAKVKAAAPITDTKAP